MNSYMLFEPNLLHHAN